MAILHDGADERLASILWILLKCLKQAFYMKAHSLILFAAFTIFSVIQPSLLQAVAPAAPTTHDADAERKAKINAVRKQALADAEVTAAFAVAKVAANKANQMVSMKMRSLDPSIAPLLDQKRGQILSPADKEKLALLRKKVSSNPQIKTELDLAKSASIDAQKKLQVKIQELDPSLASTTEKKGPKREKSGGKSGENTAETPTSSGPGTTDPSSGAHLKDKASPAE